MIHTPLPSAMESQSSPSEQQPLKGATAVGEAERPMDIENMDELNSASIPNAKQPMPLLRLMLQSTACIDAVMDGPLFDKVIEASQINAKMKVGIGQTQPEMEPQTKPNAEPQIEPMEVDESPTHPNAQQQPTTIELNTFQDTTNQNETINMLNSDGDSYEDDEDELWECGACQYQCSSEHDLIDHLSSVHQDIEEFTFFRQCESSETEDIESSIDLTEYFKTNILGQAPSLIVSDSSFRVHPVSGDSFLVAPVSEHSALVHPVAEPSVLIPPVCEPFVFVPPMSELTISVPPLSDPQSSNAQAEPPKTKDTPNEVSHEEPKPKPKKQYPPNKNRCPVCAKLFLSEIGARNHLELNHPDYVPPVQEVVLEAASSAAATVPVAAVVVPEVVAVPVAEPVPNPIAGLGGNQNRPNQGNLMPRQPNDSYETQYLTCYICQKDVPNRDALFRHKFEEHAIRENECMIAGCKESFLHVQEYRDHRLAAHHSFICKLCNREYGTFKNMNHHVYMKHTVGCFKCNSPGCHYTTELKQNIYYHVRKYHLTRNVG